MWGQQYVLNKAKKIERVTKLSSAEVKLLILIGYYFMVYFIFMTIAGARYEDVFSRSDVYTYLCCELYGHDPNDPCDDSVLQMYRTGGVFTGVLILLLNILGPLLYLVFVVDIQELKEKFGGCIKSFSSSSKTK